MVGYSSSTGNTGHLSIHRESSSFPVNTSHIKRLKWQRKKLAEINATYVKTKHCQYFGTFSHDWSLNAL